MSGDSQAKKAKPTGTQVVHFYYQPTSDSKSALLLHKLKQTLKQTELDLEMEWCFNVELTEPLTSEQEAALRWVLKETYEDEALLRKEVPFLTGSKVIEIGPRLCFSTPWSSNAQSVLQSCGLTTVRRIERSKRFKSESSLAKLVPLLYDRMTEERYPEPLASFELPGGKERELSQVVPLHPNPSQALRQISDELGLSFDDWDVNYYANLFQQDMKRDPTDVELFDLAQSNSEHSRHWFFGGRMVFDGVEKEKTLFDMVKSTLKAGSRAKQNSVIAFHDNSSAIRGFEGVQMVVPEAAGGPSRMVLQNKYVHGTYTAETHNFPTGVCPFPGAETGTGGRIRDVQSVGRGGRVIAGTSAYCVGVIEDSEFQYPGNLALPLDILIEASNGASDYGNKFGEPVVGGFTRSFGMRLPNGERREWLKPVMFTSGLGFMEDQHSKKGSAEPGMLIFKIGGPAYRIGMGGGAASSRMQSHDENDDKAAKLDFDAVQRGDAEMENKMNRVVRACIELGDRNPIWSIHDQGAGGNGNVLKEISEPMGGEIYLGRLPIGDNTMSARELWTAEYQENDAMLVRSEDQAKFESLCVRERSPFACVGVVNDSKRIKVYDGLDAKSPLVVDFELEKVLGKLPPKTFTSKREAKLLKPFALPSADVSVAECVNKVLSSLSVGSKRFLTNKVDRCVSGLVAQQQCVGPLHTPLADVSVLSQSFFGKTGVAFCSGEQPIKGLVDSKSGARMSVGEALSNLVWAKVVDLHDVKVRGNWMWPAKLEGEACEMYDACEALCDTLLVLGVGMDGGKDSLSMAAKAPAEKDLVKAPGQICVSCYAMVPDISLTVTPDLKNVDSVLLLVECGTRVKQTAPRLGGSALAQAFGQLSDDCPDMDDVEAFGLSFRTIQALLEERAILAGHDRSDGGLISCVLEMCFAGNLGATITLEAANADKMTVLRHLFGEELGFVIQVENAKAKQVVERFTQQGLVCSAIGQVAKDNHSAVEVSVGGSVVLANTVQVLRDVWESTSFKMERRQTNPECVAQEEAGLKTRKDPAFKLTYVPEENARAFDLTRLPSAKPRVACIREEGSNGDREMAGAFFAADFDAWDVTMDDLKTGRIGLESFRGVAFTGGFSFADVFGSAKGWGAGVKLNASVKNEFDRFKARTDTFSLGVCNGCQLLALLGWVPGGALKESSQPRFVHNESGRFESRYTAVRIEEQTPAVMLKGMGGSVLGVWIAHGEGQAVFPDEQVLATVEAKGLAPIRYVNDDGVPTQEYPFNPNGSRNAIAALCSDDGRHLALMPHPERAFRMFQLPWVPAQWKQELKASPWMRLFQNARTFCDE